MRRTAGTLLLIAAATLLAGYTQLTHLTSVPGLHFDEAWQGLFAQRIAREAGFHPTMAMNSYTSPVIHAILAAAFNALGPSLEVMRGVYAALNLASLALLAGLLWWTGERLAVAWFVALWALLPLSVHDHRFYVEVTGLHGFCLALTLWGLALWRRAPGLSFALVVLGVVTATWAHILFVAVFFAGIFSLARSFPAEFRSRRSRALLATVALLLAPLPLRMGLGLHKFLPFALTGALVGVAFWALVIPGWIRFESLWDRWPRRAMRLSKLGFVVSVPFLVGFVALLWNGLWPYAQATGHLDTLWLPLNAALFLAMMVSQLSRRNRSTAAASNVKAAAAKAAAAPLRKRYRLSPGTVWGGFVATFLVTSVLILKQTPRYYMVPAILAMLWCAQRLARVRNRRFQAVLAVFFVGYNLWAFQYDYLDRFEREGSNTREFKIAFYHDNGRDFRPFQRLYSWAGAMGCLASNPWVEDDRFKLPFDFLRLTEHFENAPSCQWRTADLFFSHIPDYDPALNDHREDANTPPPAAAPNVKFLAHFPEWGDLALWIRR